MVLLLIVASAQIALPLTQNFVAGLTTVVVLALTSATFLIASFSWRPERLLAAFLSVVAMALVIESLGSATGLPFGHYSYSDRLQPQVLGVPVIVAMAWFAMGLPALEVARRLFPSSHRRPVRWLVAGFLLTAWDLFLDPQMVAEGFWSWAHPSGWYGIPWSNYAGWLIVGSILAAMADVIGGNRRFNLGLVGVYGWMAVMSTLGFILPFVFDQPVIGLVGGVAMGIPLWLALRIRQAPWPASS